MKVFAIVLAAGRGRRMGGPKHLIEVGGVPMVIRVAEALRSSRTDATAVVLRPGDSHGSRLLSSKDIRTVYAEDREEGRAASLRAGVRAAPEDAALLIALADQPYLEAADFDRLIEAAEAGAPIVHASYDGQRGSPVLFAPRYRDELLALSGGEGGRVVIARHPDTARPVELDPSRGRDLDRPEDVESDAR